MKRTNIYLADGQSAALDEVSRARGISRAELIRELIDSGITGAVSADLDADLAAIEDAFGVLADSGEFIARGPDDRARHLDRIAGR
jgi:hypothetical protein